MALSFNDRISGGIWGLLVGDALGVPYEFHPPADLPPLPALEMTPPTGFRRAHAQVLLGVGFLRPWVPRRTALTPDPSPTQASAKGLSRETRFQCRACLAGEGSA